MNQDDIITYLALAIGYLAFMFPLAIDSACTRDKLKKDLSYDEKHPNATKKPAKKKPKDPDIVEPYDTKEYWKDPLNSDLSGF